MTDSISIEELTTLLAENRKTVLLDVRRKNDFEQSPRMIPCADWRDPENIETWMDAVPKDQDVVVYCVKGGMVSQSVAEKLAARSCRAKFLEGGILAWQASGKDVA